MKRPVHGRIDDLLRLIAMVLLVFPELACRRVTDPPAPLSSGGLSGAYKLIEFIPNAATTGSLTLRADSTYALSLDPWPVNKYMDGCTVVSGTTVCLDDEETNEPNPDLVGAQTGTWRYEGGHAVSLQPPAAGAERWYGSIEGPDLVFDSGYYPSATFRKR
jgi:hypothetical protein